MSFDMVDEDFTLVLFGPTASGKSSLAMRVARAMKGSVINADTVQCYKDLRILSARPSVEDEACVPHDLYGFLEIDERVTAWRWAAWAQKKIETCKKNGLLPILCGGSGFYLEALIKGLDDIPPIPQEIRHSIRLMQKEHPEKIFLDLKKYTLEEAEQYRDPQRAARALEVFLATGRSLSSWKKSTPAPSKNRFFKCLVMPTRKEIYQNCNLRFEQMIENGAIEEVRSLTMRFPNADPALPVMKAHGVQQLLQWIAGEISLEEAKNQACQITRHYAKRQMTWIRQRFSADLIVTSPYQKASALNIIKSFSGQ